MTTPQSIATVPADGRITSLQTLTGSLVGTEVMYIVSPGNAQLGSSYQITLDSLASFFGAAQFNNRVVIGNATTYNVQTTDTGILVNNTINQPISIVFPESATMVYPYGILVKCLTGNEDTYPITISFTGGELCDGLSTIPLGNPYAWTTINPLPASVGNGWFMS